MNTTISTIIFAALIIYFAFSFKKSIDRTKTIYSQGEYKEFSYYTATFYVYLAISVVLIILLIYKFKYLGIIEIILGLIFIVIMCLSTFWNTKVIVSLYGIYFNYYVIQYKNISKLDIISVKNKYRVNFFKSDKIIFSLKINKEQKNIVVKFVSNYKNIKITEK